MKKHDENKCIRSLSRIGRVDYANKTIQIGKGTLVGIRRLGMIDYLTHYLKWRVYFNGASNIVSKITNDEGETNTVKQKISKKLNRTPRNNKTTNKTLKNKRNERS